MTSPLPHDIYKQHTLIVAEQLIGCYLVRRIGSDSIVVQINETEAYRGADDPASHAHQRITPRNAPMFEKPGQLYMYLSYGMHYCMNIVTEPVGMPGAVLIRGAAPIEGIELIRKHRGRAADRHLLNGPGKLAQALQLDLSFNRYDLCGTRSELQLIHGSSPQSIKRTERIGISEGQALPWRFVTQERS